MTPIEIKDGLERALKAGNEGITIDELGGYLNTGQALLWRGNRGVLVTTLHDDPRCLHVWLGAGDLDELVTMEPGISAWARARGCEYASIDGRPGWSRVFKKHGFIPVNGELRKYYVEK